MTSQERSRYCGQQTAPLIISGHFLDRLLRRNISMTTHDRIGDQRPHQRPICYLLPYRINNSLPTSTLSGIPQHLSVCLLLTCDWFLEKQFSLGYQTHYHTLKMIYLERCVWKGVGATFGCFHYAQHMPQSITMNRCFSSTRLTKIFKITQSHHPLFIEPLFTLYSNPHTFLSRPWSNFLPYAAQDHLIPIAVTGPIVSSIMDWIDRKLFMSNVDYLHTDFIPDTSYPNTYESYDVSYL